MNTQIRIEACINSSADGLIQSVQAARDAGVATIELCSAMHMDGLTPAESHIAEVRQALPDFAGLMVMIRPRDGDFVYTDREIILMMRQIKIAAEAGADGVVFGVLRKNRHIAVDYLKDLINSSQHYNLKTTFHRAFDAAVNPAESLEQLISFNIDRVLTSGTDWYDKKTALEGIDPLKQLIQRADNRIEIVIGGGINANNVKTLIHGLPFKTSRISLHTHTGIMDNGIVTQHSAQTFIEAAR